MSVHAKVWDWLKGRLIYLILGLIALVIYVAVFYYQAQESADEARYQRWITQTVSHDQDEAKLSIAYPGELRLESPGESQPISVWFWRATPTVGPTPTFTPTPTGTLSPTLVPTATLLPTPTPRPWIVAFDPHDEGILFTDRDGVPVAPQVALTPGMECAAPAVLYVQQAPLATEVSETHLLVSVYGPNAMPVPATLPTLSVALESEKAATSRHFWDLVLGPTTSLAALAAALVAFAVQEWRRQSEHELEERLLREKEEREVHLLREEREWEARRQLAREERDERRQLDKEERDERRRRLDQEWQEHLRREDQEREDRRLQEERRWEEKRRAMFYRVETLARLGDQPERAIDLYLELYELTQTDPDWQDADAVQRLDQVFRETVTTDELVVQAGKWFGQLEYDKARLCCQLLQRWDRANKIAQSFLDVLDYAQESRDFPEASPEKETAMRVVDALKQIDAVCDGAGKARVDRLLMELAKLAKRKEWEDVWVEARGFRRESLRWLEVRPAAPPADPQEISNWLRVIGLRFNPFGPEAAELDPRLYEYGVGAVFERARGKRPMLVFGAPGCGKTGAALLLAWYCVEPLERPREAGAFPVYYTPPTDLGQDDGQRAHLAAAARAIAHSVARYLAHRGESFLDLSPPHKYSLARLLSLWGRSAEDLAARLQQVGPDWGTSSRLVREVIALYQKVPLEEMTVQAYLDLLAGARPYGFECLYLLGDLPGRGGGPRAQATARSLRLLIDLTVPLASRNVYLKLFLSDQLRSHLGDLRGYEAISLTWSRDQLRKMLSDRFRQAGGEGLGAMCLPPHPELDEKLVEVADGSPRRLVRAGNDLLREHVRRPGGPLFGAEWAVEFLQTWGGNHV